MSLKVVYNTMDFLQEIGSLAVASRLRRLAERFVQEAAIIYQSEDLAFEPRWFPVFYLISQKPSLGVVEIAKHLGITHPAVNQIAGEMIKHGLVEAMKDATDKRKRLLKLTPAGEAMLPSLQETWRLIQTAVQQTLDEAESPLLTQVDQVESVLIHYPLHQRFNRLKQSAPAESTVAEVEIVPYQPQYQPSFAALNTEWIKHYFELEPEDERILSQPEVHILNKGGQIFFARCRNSRERADLPHGLVGTVALTPKATPQLKMPGCWYLSKMSVHPDYQGQKIGKHLLSHTIEWIRAQGGSMIELETNQKLKSAITLYKGFGFMPVEITSEDASPYQRVDMRMRLTL